MKPALFGGNARCWQARSTVHAAPLAAPRPRLPLAGGVRARHLQVCCALHDPWATLGVDRNASEKEVKKAHRKLVLQYHPDVKSDDPVAHVRFMRIQEAYELLMGKRQGKEVEGRPTNQSGWDFHDWYWKFSMKRRRKGPFGAAAAAADEPPPGTMRQQWQAQMAGLKQKAATKRQQRPRRGAWAADAAGAGQAGAAGAAGAPAGAARSAAVRESVWRSTTRNARKEHKAAAEAKAAAAAAAQKLADQQRAAQRAVAAGDGSQEEPRVERAAAAAAAAQAAEPAQQQDEQAAAAAAAAQQASKPLQRSATGAGDSPVRAHTVPRHSQPSPIHHEEAPDAANVHHDSNAGTSSSAGAAHAQRLQQLLQHASNLAHSMRRESEGAALAGAERLGSHVVSLGRHLRGRLSLQQLASLLDGTSTAGGSTQHHQHQQVHAAPQESGHATATTAVPAGHGQPQVHHSWQAAAAAPAEPALEQKQQQQHSQEQQQYQQQYRSNAHSRKFANRDEVEGRLSSQLAGLKRRAALKHEVYEESNC